jgi:hypothetical protein
MHLGTHIFQVLFVRCSGHMASVDYTVYSVRTGLILAASKGTFCLRRVHSVHDGDWV